MRIYEAEKFLGLENRIKDSKAVIAAKVKIPTDKRIQDFTNLSDLIDSLNKSNAQNISSVKDLLGMDQPDLSLIIAVLVSAGWNLNDDIFLPAELWRARHTPKHKPMNDGHNANIILGHIVESRAVDKDGKEILVEDESELPDEFDLEVAGVLYSALPELSDKINAIIEKAQDGSMFVSMEVWFTDFGYGIIDTDGSTKILERNEKTAFLTQHLKVFGGNGEIEGKKIGRVLKNMVFAGQGFTEKPANRESVIRTAASEIIGHNSQNVGGGVKNVDMDELKENSEKMGAKIKELEIAVAGKNQEIEDLKNKVAKLNDDNRSIKIESEKVLKEFEGLKESSGTITEERNALKQTVADLEKEKQNMFNELEEIRTTEIAKERLAKLAQVKKVIENEKEALAELKAMSQETFEIVLKYASGADNQVSEDGNAVDAATAELDNLKDGKDDPDMNINDDGNKEKEQDLIVATAQCLFNREEDKNDED